MKLDINLEEIKSIIQLALKEDIGTGDITTSAIFKGDEVSEAVITAKEEGIICGGPVVEYIYKLVDPSLDVKCLKGDGEKISAGDDAVIIHGLTKSILSGERVALNFLGHMSGVATISGKLSSLLEGTSIKLLDTRKTLPGFRILDKYAVRAGGAHNHRTGLYDMVLIKDNHINAAGSITGAVKQVKDAYGAKYRIEVETMNLEEVNEALDTDVDIIMLDNMDKETMREAIDNINGKSEVEASGNMNEERIREIRDLRLDYISIGAITHSVKSLDLSMRFR